MKEFDFPDLFNVIVLGGQVSPGKATITGHDRDQNWNIQQAKGQIGASSTLEPPDLGEFQVSFELTSDAAFGEEDDFTRWDTFQRLIESTTSGPTPFALPIYHPDLARNGFTEVVNRGIGGMLRDSKGGGVIQVKFGEHRPAKPKATKRAESKPNAGGTGAVTGTGAEQRPDPNAAAKRELAGLVDEAKRP